MNSKKFLFVSLALLFSLNVFAGQKKPPEGLSPASREMGPGEVYRRNLGLSDDEGAEKPRAQLIKFNFEKETIEVSMSRSGSWQSESQFSGVKKKSEDEAVLMFSTPQFSGSPNLEVPVKLIKDFEGNATLEADIEKAGFKKGDAVGPLGKPRKKTFKKSIVYSWTTPTSGSSEYLYYQNPRKPSMAVRIGPFASIVAAQFDFDWASAKWESGK